jgi:Tol biopolymer transport system component
VRPAWSPDGRVLFSDFNEGTVTIFDPRRPWHEQKPEILPRPPGPKTTFFVPTSWSPDGRRLAGTLGPTRELVVYDFVSRQYDKVANEGSYSAWLRDGRLLFTTTQKLMLLDFSKRSETELYAVNLPGAISAVTVSADNKTIIFLSISTESDIWMVELAREK